MAEIKWDVKKGVGIFRVIHDSRLKRWISTGKIKGEEALVWRSGLSGWRKPEELEELKPYFKRWDKSQLRKIRKKIKKETRPSQARIKDILIVDDEKDLTSLLSEILTGKDYNVFTANTKKEAIAFIKGNKPDLVFLDLKLPDGDGIKVLSKIKKMSPQTKVNIISAYGNEERIDEAKKSGAYDFIDKPFTEKEILKSIRSVSKR